MLPADIEGSINIKKIEWKVPCGEIIDKPRFGYRGLMLDVSRYFIPKETVLKIIEAMSMLKLNILHLHLVDDNGWRIEIKKYPRLTGIGAWCVNRNVYPFPNRRNQKAHEPATVGGFYTQDDVRKIVSFAADRQIDVIPEIEMPAHTVSSLAAYPELACPVDDEFFGVIPGGGEGRSHIYCAGNDSVFTFLQDVLDEIMVLFPSKYIHLGGDEANKYYWKKCPRCQLRMKKENIQTEEELQGYFMKRVGQYVQSKGKEVMGWDELTNSKIPENAIIFGWQGNGQEAIKAAKLGHRFVMTPAKKLYLIRYQGPQWFEPFTYFGNNTLKDVYDYEPVQPDWDKNAQNLLMGVQASLWTEFCSSPEDVLYLVFPRLIAFADMAWRDKNAADWNDFLPRLDAFTDRLAAMRISFAASMYNLDHLVLPIDDKRLEVSISCIRPDVQVHYTVDGSQPTHQSHIFEKSLVVDKYTFIKAAAFKNGLRMGEVLSFPIRFNKATAAKIKGTSGNLLLLVNGVRGSLKHTDSEWRGWYDTDFSFVIDLGTVQALQFLSIGTITNSGMGVHQPSEFTVSVSENSENFHQIGQLKTPYEEIFREGTFSEDKSLLLCNISARYIRIDVKNPGICPPYHVRQGQKTWVYLDEVVIN